ncbi:DoxX family protein [Methylobacterium sp. J-043]|nr:DoxX family protein [Methylobacterium sp. J-043]
MTLEVFAAFAARACLVLLFLPFSALDKVLNFSAAVGQAAQAARSRPRAMALILAGLFVEVTMSLGVLTGIADRFAAFVLAGYCMVTALLWKPFWRKPDFRLRGSSEGRETFWDFLKNFAVAGGFLALAWGGPSAQGVAAFLHDPFGSTHPYEQAIPETGR